MFDDGCTELETYNTRWHTRTLYANPTDFTYLNIQKWITLQWTIKDSSIRGLSIRLHSHDSCSHDRSVCSAWSLISSKSGNSNLLSALPPNHWVTFSYFSSWQLPTTTCMLITVSRAVEWNICWLRSKVWYSEGLYQHFISSGML